MIRIIATHEPATAGAAHTYTVETDDGTRSIMSEADIDRLRASAPKPPALSDKRRMALAEWEDAARRAFFEAEHKAQMEGADKIAAAAESAAAACKAAAASSDASTATLSMTAERMAAALDASAIATAKHLSQSSEAQARAIAEAHGAQGAQIVAAIVKAAEVAEKDDAELCTSIDALRKSVEAGNAAIVAALDRATAATKMPRKSVSVVKRNGDGQVERAESTSYVEE